MATLQRNAHDKTGNPNDSDREESGDVGQGGTESKWPYDSWMMPTYRNRKKGVQRKNFPVEDP